MTGRKIFASLPVMALFLAWPQGRLNADPAEAPALPDRELAEYLVSVGTTRTVLRESVVLEQAPEAVYHVATASGTQDSEVMIARKGMVPLSFRRTSRRDGMTLETLIRLSNPREPAPNEMMVLDFTNLFFVLRRFPFDSPQPQQITFVGNAEENGREATWKLSAGYAGRETVIAGGRSIECHKLVLSFQVSGPMSLFAGMVPKTFYWFSVAKPHYCVKYTGVAGPPGSPTVTRLLTSYSGW